MFSNVNSLVKADKSNEIDCHKDQKPVIDIKWSTLSDCAISNIQVALRKTRSEIQIESNVNYDDLCGPWVYLRNPLYSEYIDPPHPSLCIWKYFTEDDIAYLKIHQEKRVMIRSLFENKFYNTTAKNVLVNLLWEFFKFARLNLFTEKSISACLGIVYLTHTFFLSRPWWTARELHQFFYQTVLLHVVLYPPKSLEVFTVNECKILLELFHEIYIGNLTLLQLLCHPNYHFTLKLCNSKDGAMKD